MADDDDDDHDVESAKESVGDKRAKLDIAYRINLGVYSSAVALITLVHLMKQMQKKGLLDSEELLAAMNVDFDELEDSMADKEMFQTIREFAASTLKAS